MNNLLLGLCSPIDLSPYYLKTCLKSEGGANINDFVEPLDNACDEIEGKFAINKTDYGHDSINLGNISLLSMANESLAKQYKGKVSSEPNFSRIHISKPFADWSDSNKWFNYSDRGTVTINNGVLNIANIKQNNALVETRQIVPSYQGRVKVEGIPTGAILLYRIVTKVLDNNKFKYQDYRITQDGTYDLPYNECESIYNMAWMVGDFTGDCDIKIYPIPINAIKVTPWEASQEGKVRESHVPNLTPSLLGNTLVSLFGRSEIKNDIYYLKIWKRERLWDNSMVNVSDFHSVSHSSNPNCLSIGKSFAQYSDCVYCLWINGDSHIDAHIIVHNLGYSPWQHAGQGFVFKSDVNSDNVTIIFSHKDYKTPITPEECLENVKWVVAANKRLVRDMIPVVMKGTNEAGLWDNVENKFYGNTSSTGQLICE